MLGYFPDAEEKWTTGINAEARPETDDVYHDLCVKRMVGRTLRANPSAPSLFRIRYPVLHKAATFPRKSRHELASRENAAHTRHRRRSCAIFDESLGRLPIAAELNARCG